MLSDQNQTQSHDLQEEVTGETSVIDCQEDRSDSSGSDLSGAPEIADVMFNYIQQQQAMSANVLANFLTSGNRNVCDALVEIKLAIDTNSRCLLKLCDLIDNKLNSSS